MIDHNKKDPVMMWKTLKKVIRGEKTGAEEISDIDFETLQNLEGCNLADRFNWYYIQSIDDMIKSIKVENSHSYRTDYDIENKKSIETVDRERLLDKLYQYGVRGMVLEWLRSYLNNRTQ